jgi:hypothetical protein
LSGGVSPSQVTRPIALERRTSRTERDPYKDVQLVFSAGDIARHYGLGRVFVSSSELNEDRVLAQQHWSSPRDMLKAA